MAAASLFSLRENMKNEPVVVVKCKAGHTREIGPEGPGPGGFPMCTICFRPMFPVAAKMRKKND